MIKAAYRLVHRQIIVPFQQSHAPVKEVCLGTSIGIFWSFTPLIGIQMYLGLITWVLLRLIGIRFYMPIAIAMIWITNPITLPFSIIFLRRRNRRIRFVRLGYIRYELYENFGSDRSVRFLGTLRRIEILEHIFDKRHGRAYVFGRFFNRNSFGDCRLPAYKDPSKRFSGKTSRTRRYQSERMGRKIRSKGIE